MKFNIKEWQEKYLINEAVDPIKKDGSKLKKLEKLAKKYGFKEVKKIPKEHEEDGVVNVKLFTKDKWNHVLVYYIEGDEELEVNFSDGGTSGNDSIDDWVDDKYWSRYFPIFDPVKDDADELKKLEKMAKKYGFKEIKSIPGKFSKKKSTVVKLFGKDGMYVCVYYDEDYTSAGLQVGYSTGKSVEWGYTIGEWVEDDYYNLWVDYLNQ